MSYRKTQNRNYVPPKINLHNPENIYAHMQRMQNLLEQYDRQNSFLNMQVRQLLHVQKPSPTKYEFSFKTKSDYKSKERELSFSQRQKEQKSFQYLQSRRASQKEVSGKKRYQYVEYSPVNMLQKTKSRIEVGGFSSNSKSKQYRYVESANNSQEKDPNLKENNNFCPKPFKPFPEQDTKYKKPDLSKVINYQSGNQASQRKSRLATVTSKQLQKISQSQEIRVTTESNLQTSVNFVPIIKRQVYIKNSSPNNSQGRDSINIMSPQRKSPSPQKSRPYINASNISLKSQKSGIEVTVSEKSQSKEKQKYIKQGTEKGYIKPVQAKVVESIIKTHSPSQEPAKQALKEPLKETIKQPAQPSSLILHKVEQEPPQTFRSFQPEPQTIPLTEPFKSQILTKVNQQVIKPQQPQKSGHIVKPQDTPTFQTLKFQNPNPQPQPQPQISQQEPGQRLTQIYPFSSLNPPKSEAKVRHVTEIGVNTNTVIHEDSGLLFRNRSFSQHRIQPSEKITYPDTRQYQRTNSRKELRGKSIQGKKKFINVISSEILAAKMGDKLNSGNLRK